MPGPDAVLESLYQAHARELQGFARRRVGREEAEDVVQDAYLHLLQKEHFETLDHPRAFLFRIASNLSVDTLRKIKTRSRHAEFEFALQETGCCVVDPESAAENAAEVRHFQASLDELPCVCKQTFVLSRIEGFTHSEIAARLNISVRTVDRHLVKATTHLRRRLKPCPSHARDRNRKVARPDAKSLERLKLAGRAAERSDETADRRSVRPTLENRLVPELV
ncbi:RNA polymerase sigma factor [Methylocapsa palsarum]|uniref:RNA polymerase sigma-70 factor, ECF subfamily n=1 Tax=Methylocapsa palsarum TaxID=1612308 RepID=A0A1I3WY05_9HYPH|nr:sigma-70 family RNA polymerase sigma factor [Methylocapsa palsarum]SFK12240.1 RNA polymerase sigma-70 factor, ECF subfamily [Methylocapsa palsarum]